MSELQESIVEKLSSLEKRLSVLEAKLGIEKNQFSESNSYQARNNIPQFERTESRVYPVEEINSEEKWAAYSKRRQALNEDKNSNSKLSGGNWLGILAVICFVIAAIFIVKLAYDSGWLNPVRQIFLSTLFGFSLIGVGLYLKKLDKYYASFLPVAGIVILYLTLAAGFVYYHLYSFKLALVFVALISILSIYLYKLIRHDVYPLLASIGAYTFPMLLNSDISSDFYFYYLVICSISFAIIATFLKSRTLIFVAAYLSIGVNFFIGYPNNYSKIVALVLPCHMIIFSIGTVLFNIKNSCLLTKLESQYFFPVLLLFYSVEYYFLDQVTPTWTPWISLIFSFFIIAVYLFSKNMNKGKNLNSGEVIFSFVSITVFHSLYITIMPDTLTIWILPAFGILFLIYSKLILNKFDDSPIITRGLLAAIIGIEYIRIVYNLWSDNNLLGIVYNSVGLVVILNAIYILILSKIKGNDYIKSIFLSASHILAISSLYKIIRNYNSFVVSASWLCFGLLILLIAFWKKDRILANSSLVVLIISAGKALIYDVSSSNSSSRIVCLIITGVVLYGCGFLFRRIKNWA